MICKNREREKKKKSEKGSKSGTRSGQRGSLGRSAVHTIYIIYNKSKSEQYLPNSFCSEDILS